MNLDVKNPTSAEVLEQLPPDQLIEEMLAKELEIVAILKEMKDDLARWEET